MMRARVAEEWVRGLHGDALAVAEFLMIHVRQYTGWACMIYKQEKPLISYFLKIGF